MSPVGINSFDEADVERFVEKTAWKESTCRRVLSELATFFTWAVEEGATAENPARAYRKRRLRGVSRYARQQQRGLGRTALMPGDFRRLTAQIQLASDTRRRHGFLVDVFTFMAATGLRRSEVCYLCVRDVKLTPPPPGFAVPVVGQICVRSWDNPTGRERFRTKTGKDRVVALTPAAAQIAARHLAQATEDDYAPLFRAPRGGRIGPNLLTEWFIYHRKAAGLSSRITLHLSSNVF